MAKKTSEFIEMQIIESLQNGKTVSDVRKLFKVSKELVARLTLKHGLRRKGEYLHSVSKEEIDRMVEMHLSGKTFRFIERELDRSYDAVNSALNSRGYYNRGGEGANRIHAVDKDYFNEIDTPQKAYFLGLLMADGSNNEKEYRVSITQAENNKELVYKLKEALKSEHPIVFNQRSLKNSNWQDDYRLHITSKTLSQSLAKHGIVQNKTDICKFPEINPEYYSHFIRGYFDGDGHVSKNRFELCGTKELVLKTQQVLMEGCNLGLTKLKKRHKERVSNNYDLIYGGRNQLKRIYEFLYKDADLYLERKKLSFESII